MNGILKIGIDVNSTNYTLCAMEPVISAEDRIFANIKVTLDYKKFLWSLKISSRNQQKTAHFCQTTSVI